MADTDDSREKKLAYHREWMRAWREANRERYNASQRAWRAANREQSRNLAAKGHKKWAEANPEKAKEVGRRAGAKWRATNGIKQDYFEHKSHASSRNIAFLLTFEEWLAIWVDSGKLELRGNGMGKYVMARYGDTGPYAVGNVRICTHRENLAETRELRRGVPMAAETRRRISEAKKAYHARIRHDTSGFQN